MYTDRDVSQAQNDRSAKKQVGGRWRTVYKVTEDIDQVAGSHQILLLSFFLCILANIITIIPCENHDTGTGVYFCRYAEFGGTVPG